MKLFNLEIIKRPFELIGRDEAFILEDLAKELHTEFGRKFGLLAFDRTKN